MTRVCDRFKDASFDNYICETPAQRKLVEALAAPITRNIFISGGVGVGKTHLCYAFLNKNCKRHYLKCLNAWFYYGDTVYTTIKDIIDCVKRGWQTGNSDNALDTYKEAKILIIDEIGLQYGTDSERIELYELFNYRYCEELPTIAVSNFTKDEVIQILGLRISDRLFSHALEFTIEGESKR